MRVPDTVLHHLHARDVPFTLLWHSPSQTSLGTARVAHVPRNKLAKAIMLEDGIDYFVAVLPATHQIEWSELSAMMGRSVRMVDETDLPYILRDCKLGAIPPIGEAYGVATVIESDLGHEEDVYLEGGDHEHLLHVDREGFRRLVRGAKTGHFSYAAM